MKTQAVLSLALVLAACADPQPQKLAADQPQATCEKTYRVGSHIPVRDCDQPTMTDAQKQQDYDQMRRATTVTSPK